MQEPRSMVGIVECEVFSEEGQIAVRDGPCKWFEMGSKACRLRKLFVESLAWKPAEDDVGGYQVD